MRHGVDERLPPDKETGVNVHTLKNVHREMLWQIARDYSGLPDVRTLTFSEIRFFYDGLRPELRRRTKRTK